jgi:lysophospholipase L1-like esterase
MSGRPAGSSRAGSLASRGTSHVSGVGKASSRTRWLVTLLALPVAFLAAELLLRAAGFEYAGRTLPFVMGNERMLGVLPDGTTTHRYDAATLWSPRPGAVIDPDVAPSVNGQGYRGPELSPERAPGSLRVALLGESVLFGYGVAARNTVTDVLPPLLRGVAPVVEVFNASVIAFTVVQGLERYRSLVRPLHPDVVCVAFGHHNEAAPARGPPDLEALAAARAEQQGAAGWWRSMRGSLRTLQGLQWLADGTREESRAADFTAEPWRDPAGPAPLVREREDLEAYGALDWEGRRRVTTVEFRERLDRLADEVEADGAQLVLCLMPLRPGAEATYPVTAAYQKVVKRVARDHGAQLLDMREAIERAYPADRAAELFLPEDPWHLSARGHALLAAKLAVCIKAALRKGPPGEESLPAADAAPR